MSILFEPDGRGPSPSRLLLSGICFLVVVAAVATAMVAVSRGAFRRTVPITAVMADVGDGLPAKSDVKYLGVRVGLVTGVSPAAESGMNDVHIQLSPQYAGQIPRSVTARVVPSNVFAVPSIQLLYNGSAAAVTSNARIQQDHSQATVRLQTSLDQLRRILAAVGRDQTDTAVGMLETLAEATSGRGKSLEDAGAQLRQIVIELNKVISVQAAPSTLDALSTSLREVQMAAPELLDTLHHAIGPMLTVARERGQLTDLLTGGAHTFDTVGNALEHNSDRLIFITTHLSPALDVLGDGASHFPQISRSVIGMSGKFDQTFDQRVQRVTAKVIVQLTPNRQYTRADCPRYGSLAGASCSTAPVTAPAPGQLPNILQPNRFRPANWAVTDIGPVGSAAEQRQIADILGGPPNAAADILFGPLARGTTVAVAPEPSGGSR
ncbi:MlaD family protein [Nocardia miyunensis]|uniref:MlaD family protein n=1 Tax=Nocardia miyunensis TaxID=282684 RepID=UPI000829C9B3|nr:MCE family protein [Nocardia miyunensis]